MLRITSAIALSTLLVACGDDPKPEPKTSYDAADTGQTAPQPAPQAGDDDKTANVGIDQKIRQMCDIPDARFDFDSTQLGAQARDTLDKLVKCFNEGKGQGHSINLVGHADPRGPESYNVGLGSRRAGAVEKYLSSKGLEKDRMETSSRGEMDATGTDEAGWARDRRVDIVLAE
jgi:peptidoglycan-associated lipoprotein